MLQQLIDALPTYAPAIAAIAAGIFAFVQWLDQRKRELSEKRFEQYWKLIETSQSSTFIAHQKVALLLLKRYPEFRNETIHFLKDANGRGESDGWVRTNASEIKSVMDHLSKTG